MMNNRTRLLQYAISAAVAGGNVLRSHGDDAVHLRRRVKESPRDIATEVDDLAEKVAIERIRRFDAMPILAEESGASALIDAAKDTFWAIDPLDGTVNYVHHLPWYAVSIAYIEKGEPIVGVVYNPFLNELYYGAEGTGAFKNHKRISVAESPAQQSLCAITFSGKKYGNQHAEEFESFRTLNDETAGCLRTGSAALNLAYVAEGRLGGACGRYSRLWDVAAGFVVAKEAGASVTYEFAEPAAYLVHYAVGVSSLTDFLKSAAQMQGN